MFGQTNKVEVSSEVTFEMSQQISEPQYYYYFFFTPKQHPDSREDNTVKREVIVDRYKCGRYYFSNAVMPCNQFKKIIKTGFRHKFKVFLEPGQIETFYSFTLKCENKKKGKLLSLTHLLTMRSVLSHCTTAAHSSL